MEKDSDIKRFYAGKKIFITGVSGFIGKVLLWKLLKSCSSVDRIYVLIRPKRGQDVETRKENILKTTIYDDLRQTNADLFQKVVAVSGDISGDGLELSDKDREMLINQVNVVFHIAAALNMEADMKTAINMNTTGTLRMLQLASKMKKLEVFIHTSTAYCYCEQEVTEEVVVPPNEDPYNVIQITKWMTPEQLEALEPELMKPHPNTYTYTKRLAEKLVADHYPQLPVAIARPSIVIPSLKEPIPGWVDNVNGPVGLMIAAGKGVCRSMLCDGSTAADMICVDVVSNGLITYAWKVGLQIKQKKPDKMPVINISASETEPLLWRDLIELSKKAIFKYPFSEVLWYPGGAMTTNRISHELIVILFQLLPAYILDFLIGLAGRKPFMVNVQKKIKQGTAVLKYFTTRTWHFSTNNVIQLKNSMNPHDQEEFPVTMKDFDDRLKYLETAIIGTRKFILNEDPSNLEYCRKKMRKLYFIDCAIQFCALVFLLWLLGKVGASFAQRFI